jgi:hypothetical protein
MDCILPGAWFVWAGLSFRGKYSTTMHLSASLKFFLEVKWKKKYL